MSMRRREYRYEMTLSFDTPVRYHTFIMRFTPPTDGTQQALGRRVSVQPECRLEAGVDVFGNRLEQGYVPDTHTLLSYQCEGVAFTGGRGEREGLPRVLLYPSMLSGADALMRAFAKAKDPGGGAGALERASALMEAMRARMDYAAGVTDEHTVAAQAFALGRGVCQDMAHVLIALCRAQGIGARYVNGLILGEGSTHAWVEIYDGERFTGLDPTHMRGIDTRYLAVSRGRDARDCAVNKGIFQGNACQKQSVYAALK